MRTKLAHVTHPHFGSKRTHRRIFGTVRMFSTCCETGDINSGGDVPVEAVRLYFVRHGRSEWNVLRKWQGVKDTSLAPEGVVQAQQAAQSLAASGVRFDLGYRCAA
eukprot:SAG11_NODE_738_length_7426_cov_14.966289_4_plen_106_part_00